ncbi:MAG: CvpA family protein [Firmicutes bacterium]|nr:CvpA family protein [Bacillota bacterium]
MNVVDYVILGIVGVSLLYGLYRGFISSVLGLVCVFAAMFAAYAIGPALASAICKNEMVVDTLVHYTDASSRLGDLDLSRMQVAGLSAGTIADIVARTGLPMPFDALLETNMAQQVFAAIGSVDVSQYINQTIVTSIVSILCYIAVFIVGYVALSLVTGLLGYIFRFPSLKYLDALLGGVFGLARGVAMVYILFALVPIFMTVLPFEQFGEMVEASRIGSALYKSNIVTTILQGHL